MNADLKVNITFKKSDLKNTFALFDLTQKQAETASKRALTKTARWVASQSIKDLSQITGIKQKIIRPRVKASAKGGILQAQVWYGENRISVMRLDPKQIRQGIQLKNYSIKGAFMYGGDIRGAFRKTKLKKEHSLKLLKTVFKREGKKRLPIIKQKQDIKTPIDRYVNTDMENKAMSRFLTILKQELKWEQIRNS